MCLFISYIISNTDMKHKLNKYYEMHRCNYITNTTTNVLKYIEHFEHHNDIIV